MLSARSSKAYSRRGSRASNFSGVGTDGELLFYKDGTAFDADNDDGLSLLYYADGREYTNDEEQELGARATG